MVFKFKTSFRVDEKDMVIKQYIQLHVAIYTS